MPSVLQPHPIWDVMRHAFSWISASFPEFIECTFFSLQRLMKLTQMPVVQHIYVKHIQDIFAWQYYAQHKVVFIPRLYLIVNHFLYILFDNALMATTISFSINSFTSTSYAPILTLSLWLQHLYLSSDISKYMRLVIQSCCGRPSERWTKWWSFISSQPIYWPFANGIEHSGRVISISSSTLPIYCCICTSHLACLCPWKCFTETIH